MNDSILIPHENTIIPIDRPVLGRDLEALCNRIGCSVKHMLVVMGISSRNKWQELISDNADLPLQDASLALLARYYDYYPNAFPPERGLNIGDVLASLSDHGIQLSASRLAVLVGRSKTVGPKWVGGTQPDPSADACLKIIDELVRTQKLSDWLEITKIEALAKGLIIKTTSATDVGIDSWGGRKRIQQHSGVERRSKTKTQPSSTKERRKPSS